MLHLTLLTSPTGTLLFDGAGRARDLRFSTGPHGFAALSCFIPCALDEAFWLYDRPGLPHVVVSDNGATVWEGRLEDVAIVAGADGGVRLTALGYWRALADLPYSALWSDDSVSEWRMETADDVANRSPEMYVADTQNRLFIGLTKNAVYGHQGNPAFLTFAVPHNSERTIIRVEFDYEIKLPANWRYEFNRCNEDFSGGANVHAATASGGTDTGSYAGTFTGMDRIEIGLYNNSGAPTTYTGETGANYLKITNLRVQSNASATLYADEIADALAAFVAAANSSQLSSSTALIQSPALDLRHEVYEDELPADILAKLAGLGDNQTPPRQWEVGVWEGRALHFRPKGDAARTWYVDVSALEVERTIETLRNSVYAVYQDATGRALRTAGASDSASISRYGLTRQAAVPANTTSSTQAGVHRDAALEDGADPRPRAGVVFTELYDAAGGCWPLWAARAGDTITIRNLSPVLSTDIDRIQSFRVAETDYDVDADRLDVVPESPLPTLETLLARRAEGITTERRARTRAGQGRGW